MEGGLSSGAVGWVARSAVRVGAEGTLPGRHEPKVQSGRLRGQTDIRGLHLKTLCASRLAVLERARPADRVPKVLSRASLRRSWAFGGLLVAAPAASRARRS